jgi:hypothetical protein
MGKIIRLSYIGNYVYSTNQVGYEIDYSRNIASEAQLNPVKHSHRRSQILSFPVPCDEVSKQC